VEEATDDNFDQVVLGTEDMVMVAFTAPWCGHCKNLKPHWAEAAAKLAGTGVRIMNLDATANERTAGKFGTRLGPARLTLPHERGGAQASRASPPSRCSGRGPRACRTP
jgi:protein disulfide-isomerase A6